MEKILYLVHRIPYPPNKGDKIRSYHLLKYLSGRYEVCLGAFIDDPLDWKYRDALSGLTSSSFFCPLDARRAKLRSLKGFTGRQALSLPYYRDRRMQVWVDEMLAEHNIDVVICFSSVMSQYVSGPQYSHMVRISDFVDIDSDKWRQYSRKKSFPMNRVYEREAKYLLDYEREIAATFDRCLFVSGKEADLFKQYAPESEERIGFFNNGVDTDYFSPQNAGKNPYEMGSKHIVFTGAMDYWANIDAVTWFSTDVFPEIRTSVGNTEFHIVGVNPSDEVLALSELPGVHVTGAVSDIRPYIAHSDLVVAPLRIARGVQNKVLEAMAMARPVVLTPAAMEGIDSTELLETRTTGDPSVFAGYCIDVIENDTQAGAARDFVEERYNWDRNLACMDTILTHRGSAGNER